MTNRPARVTTAGLSLVEVLVALAVFAVIGTAAFALLDQTLRSQRLAGARLERLMTLQRAMRILSIDTMQALPDSLAVAPDGVRFQRLGQMRQGSEGLVVSYMLDGSNLIRQIGAQGDDPARQVLMQDVGGAAWRIVKGGKAAVAKGAVPGAEGVELVLDLAGGQTLRGLFPVPHDTPASAGP